MTQLSLYSPLRIIAGSTRRSIVIGRMAEISATATLPASTCGKTPKRGTTGAWKLTRPIHAATPMPMKKPRIAPTTPSAAASAAKNPLTRRSEAPRAFMIAKSWRRPNLGAGQNLRELANQCFNFRGASVGGNLDSRRRDAGPALKFRLIEINTTVFARARLEHASGSELDLLTLKGKLEGLAIGADDRGGAHADEGFTVRVRPMVHLPPVVQLAGAREVGADNHDRLAVLGAGHSIRERNGQRFCSESRFDFGQRVGGHELTGQGLAVLRHDNYVGPIISELRTELRLHIDVKVHHRGGNGGGNNHGKQGSGRASATKNGGAKKHACEHRSVR